MRVRPLKGTQCPKCGEPVDVLESIGLEPDGHSVLVKSEPCMHQWRVELAREA